VLDRISANELATIDGVYLKMPIFEYICKECEHQFEVIVQGNRKAECPSCRSKRLEKQLSVFAAAAKGIGFESGELPAAACGSCGDPRGPGSCSFD
jgi:putative FmdB family regulatory protein